MTADSHAPVRLRQSFATSPARLFSAWTEPNLMKRWMFIAPERRNQIYKVKVDLRAGGTYSILEWTGAEDIDHFGHYEEIDGPSHLVFTLSVPKHFAGRTRVRVDIESHEKGAALTFEQTGVDPHLVTKAWLDMFDALAGVVGDSRSREARTID